MSNSITLYCERITPRLQFIAELLITDLIGFRLQLIDNIEDEKTIHINYSYNPAIGGYQIQPNGLLKENGIKPIATQLGSEWHEIPTITLDNSSFDIFASSFYLTSRYEEYLPYNADTHNRFTAPESCLHKLNVLKRPIVNEWALALRIELLTLFPGLKGSPRIFEYQSTIDIDQAWKFRYKGFIRTLGGFSRDIIKQNWPDIHERLSVLLRKSDDPFFNFDYQDEIHKLNNTNVTYFIQIGDFGRFDKNTKHTNNSFGQLIKRLNTTYRVGIHPSYQSNTNEQLVRIEKQRLEDVVDKPVLVSRQHFLMHQMPSTYQHLASLGICEEHTMGYSTHLGFRAGIAAPFHFFDLEKNYKTDLELIPFCCMDITPLHYEQLTPEEAKNELTDFMKSVKKVGGLFVSLWHNESLSESGRWKGWRTVYEHVIQTGNRLAK